VVSSVEIDGISGHEFAHKRGQSLRSAKKKKVKMVPHEGPGQNSSDCNTRQVFKPTEEFEPIRIISKDCRPLDPPGHHMVECSRDI
jgi:hypothetical protein